MKSGGDSVHSVAGMKHYKIVIEGVFVNIDIDGKRVLCGFFSTFYVSSVDAVAALAKAGQALAVRMAASRVDFSGGGLFSSFFFARNFYEVKKEMVIENSNAKGGFTFFRLGFVGRIWSVVRVFFIKIFRDETIVKIA